ncbi:MAG: hypothetical protein AAF412_07370 [Pseudomonadota bacterium]
MTEMFSSDFKITAVLIGIHWIPLLLAAWIWPLKKLDFSFSSAITLLLTVAAWIIVAGCLMLFSDVQANGQQMTGFAAYLIYSFMSLGAVPAAIIAIHVFAGRSLGMWIRSGLRGRHSGNAGQKSSMTFGR